MLFPLFLFVYLKNSTLYALCQPLSNKKRPVKALIYCFIGRELDLLVILKVVKSLLKVIGLMPPILILTTSQHTLLPEVL